MCWYTVSSQKLVVNLNMVKTHTHTHTPRDSFEKRVEIRTSSDTCDFRRIKEHFPNTFGGPILELIDFRLEIEMSMHVGPKLMWNQFKREL